MTNVLLVEDSPTQAEFYRENLLNMGMEVDIATDGQAALEMAYQYPYDLIILDINLPVMNGIQVCSRLNRDETTSHIPVIMLTRRDDAEDALRCLGAGAVDYIAKDKFAIETLTESLRNLGFVAS